MAVSGLTQSGNLADYFRERLTEVGAQLAPVPQEDTLWYLGNLLARFGESRQLFSYAEGETSIRPLALLYQDAMQASSEHDRCLILRQLGDLSLFLGALFPENYARRGIRKDYFVGMGGGAYDYLAENAPRQQHVFSELSRAFARMLEIISRACSRESHFDATDVLNLYQRWQHSNDPLLADQLKALGINTEDAGIRH